MPHKPTDSSLTWSQIAAQDPLIKSLAEGFRQPLRFVTVSRLAPPKRAQSAVSVVPNSWCGRSLRSSPIRASSKHTSDMRTPNAKRLCAG